MIRTALFLIATLALVPVAILYFDVPMSDLQRITLQQLLTIYGVVAALCFIIGELTGNVSQVDKLWSIIPIVYTWYMAYCGGYDTRLLLMAILVTIWGCRLTYNFSRRDGYSWRFWTGVEDYRWDLLRKMPHLTSPWVWRLFHLLFICTYQMGLILLFCLPMLIAFEGIGVPLSIWDYILAIVMLGLVIIEYIADQQMYDFQTEKYRRISAQEDLGSYGVGYVHTGLWTYVRHPNYAAEQSIWITFYLFSIVATGRPLNWTIAGCILLMLLFLGSSDFSEKITASKYPTYQDYQRRTPRFWPFM
jgi:steroid 5-alpha reductase family enzyme